MITADLLTAPPITPLTGTLLEHATIHEGITSQVTTDLFESYNCLTTDRRATWPCPTVYLTEPTLVSVVAATTGGTLAAGTYRFTVTGFNRIGETIESNEISATTTGSTSKVTITWNAEGGADGYRIYATNAGVGTETYLVEVDDPDAVSYVWTGTPAPSAIQPPSVNTAQVIGEKTFSGPSWPDGARFTVYAGVDCKRFGTAADRAAGLAEGERVFKARESYGVERAVIETVLQGATDLTPTTGAVTPAEGLALLEGDASTKYAGVPTIHSPRLIASLLMQNYSIEFQGGKLYSRLGSKVAAGGGYDSSNFSPDGDAPDEGEMWLYASGEVLVLRSGLFTKDELDRDTNESIDLIERTYIVAVDCYTSAVLVKVES